MGNCVLLRQRKPPTEDLINALAFLVTLPLSCLSGADWKLYTVIREKHNSPVDHCAFSVTSDPILSGLIRLKVSPIAKVQI